MLKQLKWLKLIWNLIVLHFSDLNFIISIGDKKKIDYAENNYWALTKIAMSFTVN